MAVILDPGALRHRLTIQQRSAAKDAYGGQSTAWVDVVTVWAEIRPLSSRELIAARGVQQETTHEIRMRYRSDVAITASMRGVYKGRIFNFSTPMNTDERNIELVIPAVEGINKG
jgi:SPP1 family predicted phage head-tail adaptor